MAVFRIAPMIGNALTHDQKHRLKILRDWNLSRASSRTAQRMGWNAEVMAELESEYKKFLAMIVLNPTKMYGMAGPVDELWHEHLCDTNNYIEMCWKIAGRIIHHSPSVDDDDSCDQAYAENTIRDLDRLFYGPRSGIWPVAGASACRGGSCVGCKATIGRGDRTIHF